MNLHPSSHSLSHAHKGICKLPKQIKDGTPTASNKRVGSPPFASPAWNPGQLHGPQVSR